MIRQFNITLLALAAFACTQNTADKIQVSSVVTKEKTALKTKPGDLFALSTAEKIFGEPAHLEDSSTMVSDKVLTYQCEYRFNRKDTANKSIYFIFEDYKNLSDAKKTYSSIKSANEHHEGIKVLENVGDEAYFHSDYENFYFILARKGTKVMRIKINRITRYTSQQEFHKVASGIVADM